MLATVTDRASGYRGSAGRSSIARCLVLGGGFLGSRLALRLAGEDHAVTVFSRSFDASLRSPQANEAGDLTLVRGEIQMGAELEQLVAAAELVFYMAGSSTPAIAHADPGGSIASHLAPALTVCSLVGKIRVSRLVMASSGGTVYGIPERLPTDERHPTLPVNLHGEHSLTLERYSRFFAAANGFDLTLLRFSNPYGPGQSSEGGQGVIAAWCRALAEGEPLLLFGDPETRRDFIFVDDLVDATIRAALEAPPGTYNVGSGVATSLREVMNLLARDSGSPAAVVHESQRPVDLPITQLDASLLAGLTGWRPKVSLEEGLRRCVNASVSAPDRNR